MIFRAVLTNDNLRTAIYAVGEHVLTTNQKEFKGYPDHSLLIYDWSIDDFGLFEIHVKHANPNVTVLIPATQEWKTYPIYEEKDYAAFFDSLKGAWFQEDVV